SLVGQAHSIDEGLVISGVIARRHRQGLTVGLRDEFRRPHVRHPYLHGPESLRPKTLTMTSNPIRHRLPLRLTHAPMLHVTPPATSPYPREAAPVRHVRVGWGPTKGDAPTRRRALGRGIGTSDRRGPVW